MFDLGSLESSTSDTTSFRDTQCIVCAFAVCTLWTQHLLQYNHPGHNSFSDTPPEHRNLLDITVVMSDTLTIFITNPLNRMVTQTWYHR